MTKSVVGETGKAAQTRALLFDMTFLMLIHIIQLYGLEVQRSILHTIYNTMHICGIVVRASDL